MRRTLLISKISFPDKLLALILLIMFGSFAQVFGQTNGDYQTRGTGGNWNANTTWQVYNGNKWVNCSLGDYPGVSSTPALVTILNGDVVTLNVSPANHIGALTINSGNAPSGLVISSGYSLIVNGATTITSNTTDVNKYITVDGNFSSGSLSMSSTNNDTRDAYIVISNGSASITGDITMSNTSSRNYICFTGNGLLYVGGKITGGGITSTSGGGTTAPTSGTVNYNKNGDQPVGAYNYYNLTLSGSGAKTFTTGISVDNNFLMTGSATFTPTRTLTVTGNTTLSGTSVLTLGAANILSSNPVVLDGGIFSTGAATGFTDVVGTLDLNENSTIALGTGTHTITFSNSSGVSWTSGKVLTISGWTGTAGASGQYGKIVVGANGLTAAQLAKVSFSGFPAGAMILASGELVPKVAAPTITSFSPDNACSGSDIIVTITGTNLTGATAVSLNGTAANSFSVTDASHISATFPGTITTGTISVTTPGGIATSSNNFTVTTIPDQPAAISGPATVCAGSSASYSIIAVAGATSYIWTFPSGWSITKGLGTTNVTVIAGSSGGNISVSAINSCGNSSDPRTIDIYPVNATNNTGYVTSNTKNSGAIQTSVGGTTGYTESRGFIKFQLNTILSNANVSSAILYLKNNGSQSGSSVSNFITGLNNNDPVSTNASTLFNAISNGTVYNSSNWSNTGTLALTLNSDAISDIQTRISTPGYIALGLVRGGYLYYYFYGYADGIDAPKLTVTYSVLSSNLSVVVNPSPTVSITGNSSICVNGTTTLSPITGGTWISNNSSVATVTDAGVVTGVSTGTVTFTFTNTTTGCRSTTGSVIVTALPTVTNPGDKTFSDQQSASVMFSGTATNYTWTNNNTAIGLPASGTGNLSFTATNTGSSPITSTITVTPSNGACTGDPVNFTITINPACTPPSFTAQPSTIPQSVCQNSTAPALSVTASGTNLTYQWYSNANNSNSGGSSISGATSSSYTPSTTTAGTLYYYCVVSGPCGSITSAVSGAVTVNANPPVSVSISASPSGDVCAGASVTYTATPTNGGAKLSYQWKVNGINVGSNSNQYSYIPVNGDVITCLLTSSVDCGVPVSYFSWNDDSKPLRKADYGLDASTGNGQYMIGGTGGTTALAPITSPKTDINLTFNDNSLLNTDGVDFSISYRRAESVSQMFTRGNSLVISGGSTFNASYLLNNGDGTSTQVTSSDIAISDDASFHDYRFVYDPSDGFGILYVDDIEKWRSSATPGKTMYWTGAGDLIVGANTDASGGAIPTFDNLSINGITIKSASASVAATVNAVPTTPIASNDGPKCEGATLNLSTSTVSGASYSWIGPNGFTSSQQNPSITNISTAASGTYEVTVTVNGCRSIAGTTVVTVNPLPTVAITNPAAVCSPSVVDLTAAAVTAGSTPGLTFSYWTNSEATNSLNNPSAVSTSGTYYIKGTTLAGCFVIQPVTVNVNPLPTTYSVTGGGTFCGTAVAIGVSGSQTGVNYQLYRDGLTLVETVAGTGSDISFTPQATSGTYTVKAIGSGGCENSMTNNAVISADTEAPVARCKDISVNLDANGQAVITPEMINNGSTDNCGIKSMSVSPSVLSCTNNTIIGYSKDISSSDGYTVHVNITDLKVLPLSLNCTNGYNYDIGYKYHVSFSGANTPSALYTLQVTFNCSPSLSGDLSKTESSGSGKTWSNQWRSMSDCAIITPEILGCSSVSILIQGPGIPTQTVALNPVTGDGSNMVTLTVTDTAGNSNNCQSTVTLNDVTPPTITCSANITVSADANSCTATSVNLGIPTTSDNCGVASVTNNAPVSFPVGNTIVKWTVTDNAGNSNTCNQTVTVSPNPVDVAVANLDDSCQSGDTGSQTTIDWTINKLSGADNWGFTWKIKNVANTEVASGTKTGLSGSSTAISYTANNTAGVNQIYTIEISGVTDSCGTSETNTANNSDSVTLLGIPAIGSFN